MANLSGYNFAYLDEQTKRMIRRAILKAVAIPGYQVPFGGREMPMPYGWGTGGIQLTASVIGESDVLKVIRCVEETGPSGMQFPDTAIAHANVRIAGSDIMMSDAIPSGKASYSGFTLVLDSQQMCIRDRIRRLRRIRQRWRLPDATLTASYQASLSSV